MPLPSFLLVQESIQSLENSNTDFGTMLFSNSTKDFHFLLYLVFIIFHIDSQAQIENIPIGKEVNVDKIYVGLLTNTTLPEKTNQDHRPSSFQLGARVTHWLIPKKLRISSWGAVHKRENSNTQFLKSYELIFNPSDRTRVSVGVMATPTTILRPNPTTWQSQVETNAESKIIGGRPGLKFKYTVNEDFNVFYGVHNHGRRAAQHLKLVYSAFMVSAYLEDKNGFIAVRYRNKDIETVANWFRNEIAISAIIRISTNLKCYLDMEFDTSNDELIFGEWGMRRSFTDTNVIRGFLSFSYNHQIKNFQGGLFIHI